MHSPYGHQETVEDYTPQASTTQTATFNGAAFDSPGASARLLLNVTAASGTSPTLDVKIQTRKDASDTFRDLASSPAFAQKTTTGTERKCFTGLDRQIRVVATIGGTTPSFTYSVSGENV